MKIELPNIREGLCSLITFCGNIQTQKKIIEMSDKVATFKVGGSDIFLRVMIHENRKKTFLHIEIAVPEYFPKGKVPTPNSELSQITDIISNLNETEIDLGIEGIFTIPIDMLPESGMIRSMLVEQKAVNTSIKLTSGTFSLTGAPVREIFWRTRAKNSVYIRMSGETKTTIRDTYLIDMYKWLMDKFTFFVLENKKDET